MCYTKQNSINQTTPFIKTSKMSKFSEKNTEYYNLVSAFRSSLNQALSQQIQIIQYIELRLFTVKLGSDSLHLLLFIYLFIYFFTTYAGHKRCLRISIEFWWWHIFFLLTLDTQPQPDPEEKRFGHFARKGALAQTREREEPEETETVQDLWLTEDCINVWLDRGIGSQHNAHNYATA